MTNITLPLDLVPFDDGPIPGVLGVAWRTVGNVQLAFLDLDTDLEEYGWDYARREDMVNDSGLYLGLRDESGQLLRHNWEDGRGEHYPLDGGESLEMAALVLLIDHGYMIEEGGA